MLTTPTPVQLRSAQTESSGFRLLLDSVVGQCDVQQATAIPPTSHTHTLTPLDTKHCGFGNREG